MRRSAASTMLLIAVVGAACMAGCGSPAPHVSGGRVFHDNAGWTISVPRGWHLVTFREAKKGVASAGVQLSNVGLPRPSLTPGFPIQVSGLVLPARGVALILATDTDPRLSHTGLATLPLSYPENRVTGSAGSGTAYIQALWFRADRKTYLATTKIGPKSTGADLQAIAMIVRSFHLDHDGT